MHSHGYSRNWTKAPNTSSSLDSSSSVIIQKRLKREKRERQVVSDVLESEKDKRRRLEEALRVTAPDVLRSLQGGSLTVTEVCAIGDSQLSSSERLITTTA